MTISGDWAVTKEVKAKWGPWGALAQRDGCPCEKRRTTHGCRGRPAEGLGRGVSAPQEASGETGPADTLISLSTDLISHWHRLSPGPASAPRGTESHPWGCLVSASGGNPSAGSDVRMSRLAEQSLPLGPLQGTAGGLKAFVPMYPASVAGQLPSRSQCGCSSPELKS